MRYLGGKSKIGKRIAEVILRSTPRRDLYVEPFFGGGGSFPHLGPSFTECIVSDIHEDLVLMWQAIQSGWVPPSNVTEDEYRSLRSAEPSALRGFVGFGCSFGGKWFGGYARCGDRNFAAESARNASNVARNLDTAKILRTSFFDLDIPAVAVVYLDPPYASTTGYANELDHARFWDHAKSIANAGAHVFVSEYYAPNDWICVAKFNHRKSVASAGARSVSTERLFVHSSQVDQLAR
jgi:DNA adenine methylase